MIHLIDPEYLDFPGVANQGFRYAYINYHPVDGKPMRLAVVVEGYTTSTVAVGAAARELCDIELARIKRTDAMAVGSYRGEGLRSIVEHNLKAVLRGIRGRPGTVIDGMRNLLSGGRCKTAGREFINVRMLHPLGASVFLTRDQLEEVFPKVLEGIAREHLEPVTVFA